MASTGEVAAEPLGALSRTSTRRFRRAVSGARGEEKRGARRPGVFGVAVAALLSLLLRGGRHQVYLFEHRCVHPISPRGLAVATQAHPILRRVPGGLTEPLVWRHEGGRRGTPRSGSPLSSALLSWALGGVRAGGGDSADAQTGKQNGGGIQRSVQRGLHRVGSSSAPPRKPRRVEGKAPAPVADPFGGLEASSSPCGLGLCQRRQGGFTSSPFGEVWRVHYAGPTR